MLMQSGHDSTLCPVDYDSAGQMIDDEIYDILVKPLPQGVKMHAILDCCHSGGCTVLLLLCKAGTTPPSSQCCAYGNVVAHSCQLSCNNDYVIPAILSQYRCLELPHIVLQLHRHKQR